MKRELEVKQGEQVLPWDVFQYITQFILRPYQLFYEREEDEYEALRTASRYGRTCRRLKTIIWSRLSEWREEKCCRVCQSKLGQINCNCHMGAGCRFQRVVSLMEPYSLCLSCVPKYCAGCHLGSCGCQEMRPCDKCLKPFCFLCRHNENIFVYSWDRLAVAPYRVYHSVCVACSPRNIMF